MANQSTPQQGPDTQTPPKSSVSHQTPQPSAQQKKGSKKKQVPVEIVRGQLENEILEDYEDEFVPPLPPPLLFPFTSEASVIKTARNPISSFSVTSSRQTPNLISSSSVTRSRQTVNPISSSSAVSRSASYKSDPIIGY